MRLTEVEIKFLDEQQQIQREITRVLQVDAELLPTHRSIHDLTATGTSLSREQAKRLAYAYLYEAPDTL